MIFFSKPSSFYERIPASCSHDVIIRPKYLILRFANCPDSKYTDTLLLTISDIDQINSTGFTATRSVHLLAPPPPSPLRTCLLRIPFIVNACWMTLLLWYCRNFRPVSSSVNHAWCHVFKVISVFRIIRSAVSHFSCLRFPRIWLDCLSTKITLLACLCQNSVNVM